MFWDGDEASHVNHEQVVGAILVWFAVITAIDVVLNLLTAERILAVRLDWWYYVDGVVVGVESWLGFSVGWGCEGEEYRGCEYQPAKAVIRAHPQLLVVV